MSLLQNCLPLADMHHGATSAVPHVAHSGFGFCRGGITNN
jgi:hypothetical protein